MAICGPAGSGKTFTALRLAMGLGKRVCVINSESGAIEKYLGASPDGIPFVFDIADMADFSPSRYTSLIQEAGRELYDVILIDSLSHAWSGSGGALELKDKKGGNSFTAWKDITPMHNAMIESILRSPAHVIATMRTKMQYILEEEVDPRTGAKKSVPKKVGMEPIQRQGMEYEFDIVADIEQTTHTMSVSKSRCPVVDGVVVVKPGIEFIVPVKAWLEDGVAVDPSYYAVRPEDLQANRQEAERQNQAAQDAAAQAERRRQLMDAASGTAAGSPAVAAGVSPTLSVAAADQAPFTPTSQTAESQQGSVAAVASPEDQRMPLLRELAGYGQRIGRTPADINGQCKQKFGAGVKEIPIDVLQKLVAAFKQSAESAVEPKANPTAA